MSFWRRFLNHFVPHRTNAYRPHLLGRGWLVIFLAVVLATEGFLVAGLVARQSGGSFLADVVASQVLSLTNGQRVANNAGALAENKLLDTAAQAKADDMAAKGYFSHQSPDGRQPWDFISAAGYDYQYAGENLAVRFSESQDVVNAWMASPTHRANIVKAQYNETGIGIAQGTYKGSSATFVVQYFGARDASAAGKPTALASPPAQGQVLGAEVGPAPAGKFDNLVRQLPRIFGDPEGSAAWILGGIATLLILILGLTFVMHLQVQATDLLIPGIAVAGIAVFLLTFNGAVLSVSSQEAAVGAAAPPALIISADAASTAR